MLRSFWQQWQHRWLDKRIPGHNIHTLNMSNIFIFPSRFGLGFLLLCALLFLLGTNYQNNLILLMSYFLISLMLVSMFVSYNNFSGLQFSLKVPDHCFAGEQVQVTLNRCDDRPDKSGRLVAHWMGGSPFQSTNMENRASLTLAYETQRRGQLLLPRITLFSLYPLGLFRCWSHLKFPGHTMVYPQIGHQFVGEEQPSDNTASGAHEGSTGHEDFQSLQPYRPGDPLHQIAWKQVAKGHELMRKSFSDPRGQVTWLQLRPGSPDTLEQRLSDLCYSALSLDRHNQRFGLRLGKQAIAPDSGPRHLHHCLTLLALYGQHTAQ
ncbi:hypothetical protein HMF8227_01024 [Saliniradius amylolyticus]|uniref:Uncharacterized protein n=1 Tax=Saliniradius amylolyticus TaxID=2183582 RepID=A0A2S2E1K1_9ALTE|nr:DUF58 domain-containing protein [Saliniradius amylolyticus]AWL11513.1 hypothetical protein HMF8227_01024 [Saliniradius amylolyticus]